MLNNYGAKNFEKIGAVDNQWSPVIYFYCFYYIVLLFGGIVGLNLNFFVAGLFLVFLSIRYFRYLTNLKFDFLVFCLAFSLIIPLIPLLTNDKFDFTNTYQELIKYYALSLVILFGIILPFPPLNQARRSWLLIATILLFLLVGWFWPGGQGIQMGRVKGFSANPNGFALSAMSILFLVDFKKIHVSVQWICYFVVIPMIYVSRTSGALMGLIIGVCYRFLFGKNFFPTIRRFIVLAAIASTLPFLFFLVPAGTLPPVDRAISQLTIANENIKTILAGKKVDYVSIIEKRGSAESSSLAWRLSHWHKVVKTYLNSSMEIQLFGCGVGMSDVDFGIKPHNDYLRIFYETGVVGFVVILLTWIILYRRMDVKYRWVPVMVAVYCFSENNYDHFPAMSLLIFYMVSAKNGGQELSKTETIENSASC